MRLTNETGFPAKLFRTSIDKDRLAASLALRVTYEWRDGQFVPCAEQDWIVSAAPWDSPHGPMPGDEIFYRDGVDIFIMAAAKPAKDARTDVVDVEARLGTWRGGVRVFGERHWRRTDAGLVASAPAPITTVPLTMERAFGGKTKWDGLDVPYALNPEGKGFYFDAAEAEGKPLANIEDWAAPVRKWDDRPMPVGVGLCPPGFGGKLLPLIDKETHEVNICGRLFNAAFPAMIAPAAAPGDVLSVRGISSTGEVKFPLPPARYEVTLSFDDKVIKRVLPIDQLGLDYAQKRMFVSYRYPFRYVLHPRQQRHCVLRRKEG
jgi:hypothetical protein